MHQIVFLDNNSTTQVLPEVVEAMLPYWREQYLNPSSVAGEMIGCSTSINHAKQVLCNFLNASEPSEFVLTSGATESNNWVIQSVASSNRISRQKIHIIISTIEHPSILETAAITVQREPLAELAYAPVDSNCVINIEELLKLIKPETRLVSVMLANNETGVLQPVGEIARRVKALNPCCLVHTDATQAIGKVAVDLTNDLAAVDFLSLSAHKFHGPKGVGALFIRQGQTLNSLLLGGGQQEGRRAGTENSPLAAGMTAALLTASADLAEQNKRVSSLRDNMEVSLAQTIQGINFLGQQVTRLPNTTFALFPDIEGEILVHLLAEKGIAVSSGSACSQGSDRPSHVATAMGIDYAIARNTLRMSLSRYTKEQEISAFIKILSEVRCNDNLCRPSR